MGRLLTDTLLRGIDYLRIFHEALIFFVLGFLCGFIRGRFHES